MFSGWLTDRVDPRVLLLAYYGLRGFSLFLLPPLFGPELHVSMIAFIVFYGLDWVATVPPTLALCREFFGPRAPVVFGWVFASHQVGSAFAAFGGGRGGRGDRQRGLRGRRRPPTEGDRQRRRDSAQGGCAVPGAVVGAGDVADHPGAERGQRRTHLV